MSHQNVETIGAMFATFNEPKAVSLRDYATRAEALAAVGLSE
jgi:hypothetical protein